MVNIKKKLKKNLSKDYLFVLERIKELIKEIMIYIEFIKIKNNFVF